jgi:hypothetical protein
MTRISIEHDDNSSCIVQWTSENNDDTEQATPIDLHSLDEDVPTNVVVDFKRHTTTNPGILTRISIPTITLCTCK